MARKAKTKQENPNENCLDGMACPRCGAFGPFKIHVTQSGIAEVDDDGTDFVGGDTEWDDDSACHCLSCGHQATVRQFRGVDDLPGETGRTVKAPREIIDDLLEYAVKFAEQNEEPDDGGCWEVIEAARAWLGQSETPPAQVPAGVTVDRLELRKETVAQMALLMEEASRNLAAVMNLPEAEEAQIRLFLPDELDGCAIILREAHGIELPGG